MAARHTPILAELAEMGLSLARAVHGQALAAETPEAMAEMTLAFHRISRSLRQTLALEAKLQRDRVQQDREVRADAIRRQEAAVDRRKHQLRMAVDRAIWAEAESPEAERLVDELDDLLEEGALQENFAADPIEVHIARLRADLGLAASPVTPPTEKVTDSQEPEGFGWRSSA